MITGEWLFSPPLSNKSSKRKFTTTLLLELTGIIILEMDYCCCHFHHLAPMFHVTIFTKDDFIYKISYYRFCESNYKVNRWKKERETELILKQWQKNRNIKLETEITGKIIDSNLLREIDSQLWANPTSGTRQKKRFIYNVVTK